MSWVPPDLASLCSEGAKVSSCGNSAFMFLMLVAQLLGHSRDEGLGKLAMEFRSPNLHFGMSDLGIDLEWDDVKEEEFDFIVVGADLS